MPDASWFRLLILEPSNEFWAPIECQLRAFKREDVRHQYETLSYAWEDGDAVCPTSSFENTDPEGK
jgi:hypothetical protein